MAKKRRQKILVFSAHPDDHLCCAGTLMYLIDKGFEVTEVVFTGGERSIWRGRDERGKTLQKDKLIKKRRSELTAASKLIGVSKTTTLGLQDSEVSRSTDLIDDLIQIIRFEKPTLLITHNPQDYHNDHREIGKISTEAADRAAWGISRELGEPHRVFGVLYMEGSFFGRSDILVDISKYEKKKTKVFDSYGSQLGDRSRAMLSAMNTYRGYFRRSEKAECFEVAKDLPIYLDKLLEVF